MIGQHKIISFTTYTKPSFYVGVRLENHGLMLHKRFYKQNGAPFMCAYCSQPAQFIAWQSCFRSQTKTLYACTACSVAANAMWDHAFMRRPMFARLDRHQIIHSSLRGKSIWDLIKTRALITALCLHRELLEEIGRLFVIINVHVNRICMEDFIDLENFIKK